MFTYQPKGALSPRLARTVSKLFKVVKEEELMVSLAVSDGKHGEFYLCVDPGWSACKMTKTPEGNISVRVRSKAEDYPNREEQKKHIERTINGLALMFKCVDDNRTSLMRVLDEVRKVISFESYGEEFEAHTDGETPDPDVIPGTIEEAVELLYSTLGEDQLAWAKKTPLYDALPQIHMGFGMKLRNKWQLHERGTPMKQHILERFSLFGHGDDVTVLVFTALWGRVRGEPQEVIDASLALEVEGMKAHWRKHGINPLTGEKGIVCDA
jgi:hypothetical protein